MTDTPPPAEELQAATPGFWSRYRNLPTWVQVGLPVLLAVIVVLVGVLIWQAAQSDNDQDTIEAVLEDIAEEKQTTPATTVVEPTSTTEEATTTTEQATTTTEEATTTTEATTTVPPTTVAPPTVAPPTVAPPTVAPPTVAPPTVAPTTVAPPPPPTTEPPPPTTEPPPPTTEPPPPTTEPPPPTTEPPPPTTEPPPPTTEPPPPTSVPIIPVPPGAVYASATAFAEAWNQNTAGTGVPQITQNDVTDVDDGPQADTVIVRLTDDVGLLGVIRNDDQSVAEAILVWVPGNDEAASNQLYRNAFDVLVRTLAPSLDAPARAALAGQLGLSATQPPFPDGTNASATASGQRYTAGLRDDGDASFITVVDARPR